MSEPNEELLSSYQKLRKQLDAQSEENRVLTEKLNAIEGLFKAEREERLATERKGILEKINAINKEFKPTNESNDDLKLILRGLELAPKSNATPPAKDDEINPEPEVPKINGKPIPEDLKQFIALREDNSKIFEHIGEAVE